MEHENSGTNSTICTIVQFVQFENSSTSNSSTSNSAASNSASLNSVTLNSATRTTLNSGASKIKKELI